MSWAWATTWALVGAVGGVVLWMVLWVVILNLKDLELVSAAELAELRRKAERLWWIEYAGVPQPGKTRPQPPLPMKRSVPPAASAPTSGSRAVQAEQDLERLIERERTIERERSRGERERERRLIDELAEGTKPLPPDAEENEP